MLRHEILETIGIYRQAMVTAPLTPAADPFFAPEEAAILERFKTFIEATPDCFERTSRAGHITGSALVVGRNLDQILLTLHGKLGIWLQLGGHADGDHQPHAVALREGGEESGLSNLIFMPFEPTVFGPHARSAAPPRRPMPFDFDFHQIPARLNEPAHIHYDVRYLLLADPQEPLLISSESKDLRWFSLEEVRTVTQERSMHRQFNKLAWLKTRLTPTS